MSQASVDARHMARALKLAARGLFGTDPNPRVGCVIADGEHVLGEGYHERAGGPHAEIVALQAAQGPVDGATAYVTLEPCCHHGRTPPCTDALIAARIGRVVYAVGDPNPRVNGGGSAQLRAAGIASRVIERCRISTSCASWFSAVSSRQVAGYAGSNREAAAAGLISPPPQRRIHYTIGRHPVKHEAGSRAGAWPGDAASPSESYRPEPFGSATRNHKQAAGNVCPDPGHPVLAIPLP